MNVAHILGLSVVAVASVVVFLLMRHPQLRRRQFRSGRKFSAAASLGCALGLFAVYALVIWWLR